jgi:hypothetical protein
MPTMAFKNFLRRNLEASEKGSDEQNTDMACLVAVTQHHMGELSDLLSGMRKLRDHKHHSPKDLTDAVIDGVEAIVTLRREIERQ